MKRYLLIIALGFAALLAGAQSVPSLSITDLKIEPAGDRLEVGMQIHPGDYKLKTNTQWMVTPVVYSKAGTDSVSLRPFLVTGKNAYYYARRQGKDRDMWVLRSGKGSSVAYSDATQLQPWMDHSELRLLTRKVSCCGERPSDTTEELPVAEIDLTPPSFVPDFAYIIPKKEGKKQRKLSGRAYVNFIVNKTNIEPNYMNNAVELKKILDTIDSVRYNADASVDTIRLTGYASPEGPYSNNVRLAKGRTEAVKKYVMGLYDFPSNVYYANSVPEDWGGLREYVAGSTLTDRDAILAFIDDTSIPIESKNDRLRAKFPTSYAFLLKNEYPWLRHTDYYIHYIVRQYTTVEEMREALKRDPRNLSLNEFFIVANSYGQGSDECCDILEQAAIYFRDEPDANLNAGNAAMGRGEYERAERYLKKAGASPEAEYARGVLDALRGNYDSAAERLRTARDAGMKKAANALTQVENIRTAGHQVKYLEQK